MIRALLFLAATGGYWGEHRGHWQTFPYESYALCEQDRARKEREAREADGLTGVVTRCSEIKERGS